MSNPKVRHTLTLDPDAVRQAHCLRRDRSLSAFVNDALLAYSAEQERAIYEAAPLTVAEQAWTRSAAAGFVGDDDDDWDALFPVEDS